MREEEYEEDLDLEEEYELEEYEPEEDIYELDLCAEDPEFHIFCHEEEEEEF
jgi:hypothetical protein